jgi:carnitine 3-dehydrogenase
MSRKAPEQVNRVGIIGTGVIGGGWALHFLAQGLDVVAFDPHPDRRNRFQRMCENAWPTLVRLGLKPGASPDRIRFETTLEEAVAQVDVVQENSPEALDSKIATLARIDAAAPEDIVVLSSTSGLKMTDMQVKCRHPGRTVVGHPFNPPYLVPLVEVVGGDKTAAEAVDWAVAFYTAFGKRPVKLDREVPGFIATRLQEAMWREMLHMVNAGEATVQQIDDAITFGPGLRWAITGPGMNYHLAGGDGGMAHVLDQFAPSLKWPWTRLEAPELTAELRKKVIDGCVAESAGRSINDMIRDRDAYLISILKVLRAPPERT